MPDQDVATRVMQARSMLAAQKYWVGGSLTWVSNEARVPGHKFQAALSLSNGLQPASLFAAGYFKRSKIAGGTDKLYLNLFYSHERIHGLHDNAPARHRNDVGVLEPLYGQRVSHPHRHRICDDAVEGYAEPIQRVSHDVLWTSFLSECNILGAPPWASPPPTQTAMNL